MSLSFHVCGLGPQPHLPEALGPSPGVQQVGAITPDLSLIFLGDRLSKPLSTGLAVSREWGDSVAISSVPRVGRVPRVQGCSPPALVGSPASSSRPWGGCWETLGLGSLWAPPQPRTPRLLSLGGPASETCRVGWASRRNWTWVWKHWPTFQGTGLWCQVLLPVCRCFWISMTSWRPPRWDMMERRLGMAACCRPLPGVFCACSGGSFLMRGQKVS